MFSIKLFKKYCTAEWLPIFEMNKHIVHVHAKDAIFSEGEEVNGIYFIEKGYVKVQSRFGQKEDKIIRLAGPEMMLGHRGIHVKKFPVSAVALSDATLTLIPIQIFMNIMKANPELAVYLINFMSDELREAEDRMRNLMLLDPRRRIAQILIKSADVFGMDSKEKNKLAFSLSRTDIANMGGTTYETVIRTLSLFEEQKLISLPGKEIVILNRKRLQEMAEDMSPPKKKA